VVAGVFCCWCIVGCLCSVVVGKDAFSADWCLALFFRLVHFAGWTGVWERIMDERTYCRQYIESLFPFDWTLDACVWS